MGITNALVVDDSRLARLTLTKLLEKRSIQVEKASSAREAFETLKANRPDLILMDVTMPDIDGLEATKMITNNPETAAIPVVMCTAEDSDEARNKAQSCGATAFLTKPAGDENLDRVLAEIAEQLAANEPVAAHTAVTPEAQSTASPARGTASMDLEAILVSAREAARIEITQVAETTLKELAAAAASTAVDALRGELDASAAAQVERSGDQEAQEAAQLAATMAAEESAAERVRELAEQSVASAVQEQVRAELKKTTDDLAVSIRAELTKQLDELLGSEQVRKRLETAATRQAGTEAARVAKQVAQKHAQTIAQETAGEAARSEAQSAITAAASRQSKDAAAVGKAKALAAVALVLSIAAVAASAVFKFVL